MDVTHSDYWTEYIEKTSLSHRSMTSSALTRLQQLNRGLRLENVEALELGAGNGRNVIFLHESGVGAITAVEFNATSLNQNVQGYPRIRVVEERMENFAFAKYHLICAHYCLSFLPINEFLDVMERIRNSLHPGGILVGDFYGHQDDWKRRVEAAPMTFVNEQEAHFQLRGLKQLQFTEHNDKIIDDLGVKVRRHIFYFMMQY